MDFYFKLCFLETGRARLVRMEPYGAARVCVYE
jgi:hypothetical protein